MDINYHCARNEVFLKIAHINFAFINLKNTFQEKKKQKERLDCLDNLTLLYTNSLLDIKIIITLLNYLNSLSNNP